MLCMLSRVMHDFNIGSEVCLQARSVSDLVKHKKFDLIVLDYADPDSKALLLQLRQPSLTMRSHIVAIVNDLAETKDAFHHKADMTLQRPVRQESAAQCIRSLYGTILQERRSSFRHALDAAIKIEIDGKGAMPATLQNISEGGVSLRCHDRIELGAKISCALPLPPGIIQVDAKVVWVGRNEQFGVQFSYIAPTDFLKLRTWLSTKFEAKFSSDAFFAAQTAARVQNQSSPPQLAALCQ